LLKFLVLLAGFLLILVNGNFYAFSEKLQLYVFIIGILLLGVPHGAADMLIASKNLRHGTSQFSKLKFNLQYLGNIAIFSAVLFFFPISGFIIFLLFSAYHFGESDLHSLNIESILGKIIVFNYGLLVLGVIFLPDFQQIQTAIISSSWNVKFLGIVNWINENNLKILLFIFVLFLFNGLTYFVLNKAAFKNSYVQITQNMVLLPILYSLPLMLSFSFYFLLWHSFFSLKSILNYLRTDKTLGDGLISKEIIKNSFIATLVIVSIAIVGHGHGHANTNNMIMYAVLGLAVLTTSHMQIMHKMYQHLKRVKKI
jgi:Brp/Blh family beta-carotene 15,15'-monooxygenase